MEIRLLGGCWDLSRRPAGSLKASPRMMNGPLEGSWWHCKWDLHENQTARVRPAEMLKQVPLSGMVIERFLWTHLFKWGVSPPSPGYKNSQKPAVLKEGSSQEAGKGHEKGDRTHAACCARPDFCGGRGRSCGKLEIPQQLSKAWKILVLSSVWKWITSTACRGQRWHCHSFHAVTTYLILGALLNFLLKTELFVGAVTGKFPRAWVQVGLFLALR